VKPAVGFIGLGTMGRPMASNLARAGFDLAVYDLDPRPVAALADLGARVADSPRAIGEHSNVVEVTVWDDAGVESVVLGSASAPGVLASARPGTIIAIHSTVSIGTCRRLAQAALGSGVSVIDAAISGGPARAAEGSLAILVGGSAEDFQTCRPLFEVLGKQVFHVGPLGAGMAAKLCNNLMVMANLQAVGEALRIAAAAGIEPERMIELGAAGTADSWALRHGFALQQRMQGDPAAGTQAQMQAKDLQLAVKLARELGEEPAIAQFFLDRARSS
jgi:3-hydroxyisobutyrate dehydrogenase-like beta-hydroxyacid dehydrogenase